MADFEVVGMGASDQTAWQEAMGLVPAFRTLTVDITNNELKHLLSSPKEIIPTPGADKYIQLIYFDLYYEYGTATFAGVQIPTLTYADFPDIDDGHISDEFDVVFTSTSSAISFGYGHTSAYNSASSRRFLASQVVNKAVILKDVADWTVGDGTARLIVVYKIIDAP